MDYSNLPEGNSPWANSSPRQSRTNFGSTTNERSSSPTLEPSSLTHTSDGPDDRPLPDAQTNNTVRNAQSFASEQSPDIRQAQYYDTAPRHPPLEPLEQQQTHAQSRPTQQQQQYQQYVSSQAVVERPPSRYKLQPKINGLERPGRKDAIFRFDVYTDLPGFRTTQFRDVRRTHSEFQRLADHLISANPEAIVPALPPSSTPAGVGTDEDDARVKSSLQRWMNYVCFNDVLMRDDEMIRFVEGDPGYSPVTRKLQPATGVRRKVIKQFAPPPDDTPELQEARPAVKLFYLGSMDAAQKVDKVVKARRGLGLTESEFGTKLSAMAEQEFHSGLRTAYRKLGRTIQTIGDLHAAQGTAEATTLADPLAYHSSDAFIVKETLTNRHILLRELIQAQQATRSRRSAADRLKASSSVRRDKVDEAITALDEACSHEQYLYQKTQRVTANLLHERRTWFARTAADLRESIREYVIRQIEIERRALATLESARPEIRAIDASGGLSRLGREAHPVNIRRTTVMSSQGPKGDAWSGVQRRPDGLNRSISNRLDLTSDVDPEISAGLTASMDGQARISSGAGSTSSIMQEDDDDRIDAKNAASRLAASTF